VQGGIRKKKETDAKKRKRRRHFVQRKVFAVCLYVPYAPKAGICNTHKTSVKFLSICQLN
jgi:hypothetical protein